jgi:hypothetical protein
VVDVEPTREIAPEAGVGVALGVEAGVELVAEAVGVALGVETGVEAVADGVGVALEVRALRAIATVAHPPLFIEPTSAGTVPAELRDLSAAATPK